jgi:hypothetical protein
LGHDFHARFTGPSAQRLLFTTVKESLKHAGITNNEKLFEELHVILRAILKEELENIFETWLERVRSKGQGDGRHID